MRTLNLVNYSCHRRTCCHYVLSLLAVIIPIVIMPAIILPIVVMPVAIIPFTISK